MTSEKLAFDGGTPVRATPMPPRIGFGPEEEKELMECIAHYRNLDSDPPYIGLWSKRFSEAFAEYQGGGFSLPVSSGTGAIYVSLASLGLPKGSTVLTSPVTCSGVLGSIQALGFVPKVVDSAPSSFNVDAEQVKARISKDVRCLLVTHAAGEPVDVPAIREAINDDSILILEDCSQATGASIRGEKVGTWGEIAAFSTMYRKNLAAGASSGLIFTKDFETYRTALSYSDRGKPVWRLDLNLRDPQYASFPALNWNSSEMSNAIGLASLRRLDRTNELRRVFLRKLFVALADADTVCSPYAYHDGFAPFYFPIFVDQEKIKVSVEQFATAVEAEGIPLGAKYGCLVNTWPWITEHLSDTFVARNALLTRNASFNLHLNENYGEREVKDIVEAFAKVTKVYLH